MAHGTTARVTALSRAFRRDVAAFVDATHLASRREARGVHRTRVAARRLTEALPLVGAAAGRSTRDVRADLRRMRRALGPLREMDVARDLLADFAREGTALASAVAHVDAACGRARDDAGLRIARRLRQLGLSGLVGRLDALAGELDAAPPEAPLAAAGIARLRRRARALVAAIDRASLVYAPAALHKIRIAAKKLRYLLELQRATLGPRPADIRRLRRLQDLLGQLHDAHTVQMRLRCLDTGADFARRRALAAFDRALETRCRRWHGETLRALPAVRRLAIALALEAPFLLAIGRPGRPARGRVRPIVSRDRASA
jgi:CHAD domain-containing protein